MAEDLHRRIRRKLRRCLRLPVSPPGDDDLARIMVRPDDILVDCGANIGDVTMRLAATGARVYAFEPNPDAFAVLKRRTAAWRNVTCYNQAVFDRHASMPLFLHRRAGEDPVKWSTGSSLVREKDNVDPARSVEVETIDFPMFLRDLGQDIRILKVDVEGAEVPVLGALLDSGLIDSIAHLFVEMHGRYSALQDSTEALIRRLDALGRPGIHCDWT